MPSARLPNARPLRIPPAVWDDPDVKIALLALDFGALFHHLLRATGATQEALANRIGKTQSEVSDYLRGERRVTSLKVARSVIEGLDMPDSALVLLTLGAFGRCARLEGSEEDPMERRDLLQGAVAAVLAGGITVKGALGEKVTAAARRPDPTTADHLAGMVQNLRALDGSGQLAGYSAALVDLCTRALDAARPQDRPAIGRVLAEAATEHWWQTWQSPGGDDPGVFQQAVSFSTEWDQPALVSYLLGYRSAVVLTEGGDPAEAARLARLAQESRWRPSPGERARAANREARALALLGDAEGARRALDAREAALDNVDADGEPPWLQWLVAEADVMKADCRLTRDGPDGTPAVEAALAGIDPSWARTRAVYRARIAAALIAAGDIDGAIGAIEDTARISANARKTLWSLAELAYAARQPHLAPVREALADHGVAVPV